MLSDLVKTLVGLGREAAEGLVIAVPGVSKEAYLVRNGQSQLVPIPPPQVAHKLFGLADLVSAAGDKALAKAPVVFYNPEAVMLVLDREDRREQVTLLLKFSELWRDLQGLAKGLEFDTKEAIRFLRFKVGEEQVGDLIASLRRIDFTRKSTGSRTVEHGRETLGRSVEETVQQADKIPTSFVVAVNPWSNPGCKQFVAPLQVGIELDASKERIIFQALPGAFEEGLHSATLELGAQLRELLPAEVPLYHGIA